MEGQQVPLPGDMGMQDLLQQLNNLQMQVHQLQQAQVQPGMQRRGVLKYPSYYHEESKDGGFLLWKSQFVQTARVNGEDDLTLRHIIKASLHQAAGQLAYDLAPEAFPNGQEFFNALEARFVPQAEANLAKVKFEQAAQGHEETIQAYHGRLRMLYARAYPHSVEDQVLIRRFCVSLRDRPVREQVLRQDPKTYVQALSVAQNEQAVGLQAAHYQLGAPMDGPEPMEIGAIGHQRPKSMATQEPCPVCGKPGHTVRTCFKLRRMEQVFERVATRTDNMAPRREVPRERRWNNRSEVVPRREVPNDRRPEERRGNKKQEWRRKMIALLREEDEEDEFSDQPDGSEEEGQDDSYEPEEEKN